MLKIVLFLFIISGLAQATSLVNRYQFLNTEVMPDGVWTFGVLKGQSLAGKGASYSAAGKSVSNQQYFSRDITYSNLLDEINEPLDKDLARSAFEVYGRDGDDYAGTVVNDVDVAQKSEAYILGRGFGEKSSVFIIFPIVTIQTSFQSNFKHSQSLLALTDQLRSEGQFHQAQEILENSENALRKRLDENGYKPNYPREFTTLANIHLTHRYAGVKTSKSRLSVDSTVVVPAGKKFDEDDFLYYKVREEQFSYRQGLIGQFELSSKFAVLGSTYYHKRFSFEQSRRIPQNSASPLSSDIDKNTNIKYGDTYGGSVQLNFAPKDALLLYLGQSIEKKVKDSVSGSKFASERYDYLEQNTAQSLGLAYVGIAVDTIQSFIANKFPIPINLNVQYSVSNSGANVFDNQAIAMNLMVFYK